MIEMLNTSINEIQKKKYNSIIPALPLTATDRAIPLNQLSYALNHLLMRLLYFRIFIIVNILIFTLYKRGHSNTLFSFFSCNEIQSNFHLQQTLILGKKTKQGKLVLSKHTLIFEIDFDQKYSFHPNCFQREKYKIIAFKKQIGYNSKHHLFFIRYYNLKNTTCTILSCKLQIPTHSWFKRKGIKVY